MKPRTKNPLATPQREKSGAKTFDNYDYQYHWALYKAMELHSAKTEYVVFVELHEDVVIGNSLVCESATFDFYQVKDKSGTRFTAESLIRRAKGDKTLKASILGKLLLSIQNKSYRDAVKTIGLVATNGFNFGNDLDLKEIAKGDLTEKALEMIDAALNEELGEALPDNVSFIVPILPTQGYKEHLIGVIGQIVDSLFPDSRCNSISIYRLLIGELHAKGKNTFDYPNWESALAEKGLTSATVENIIQRYTDGIDSDISQPFTEFVDRIGRNVIQKNEMKKAMTNYMFSPQKYTSAYRKRSVSIRDAIKSIDRTGTETDIFSAAISLIPDDTKRSFASTVEFEVAVICELLQLEG